MRYLLFLALLALASTVPPAQAQVCEGTIILSDQDDVDAFDCTEVTGSLFIGTFPNASDIISLSPLSGLTSVGEDLFIRRNVALESLAGLESIGSVGDDLVIESNIALSSLSGLDGVVSVGGSVEISSNGALTSLSGLEGLASVGDDVRILQNSGLISLSGLENLTSATGFSLLGNGALETLEGLEGLASITFGGGGLSIQNNNSLQSLSGLDSLRDCLVSYATRRSIKRIALRCTIASLTAGIYS
ncbi:MAG: hypothetical protein AAGI91_00010 [Bacteroidota bacterium]